MSEEPNQGGGTATDQKDDAATAAAAAKVAELETQIANLKTESAKYRTARNEALKQAHALDAVVKAHNIAFDAGSADTSALKIEDGKVVGAFDYKPATPPKTDPPKPADAGEMSMVDVKNMTAEQIADNWDQVRGAMKKGYG